MFEDFKSEKLEEFEDYCDREVCIEKGPRIVYGILIGMAHSYIILRPSLVSSPNSGDAFL